MASTLCSAAAFLPASLTMEASPRSEKTLVMTRSTNHEWETLEARIAANEQAISDMRRDFSSRCHDLEALVKLHQSRIERLNQPDSSQAQPIKDDRNNEKEALAQMGNQMIQLVQELLGRIDGIERRLDKGTGSNGNGQR